MKGFEGRYETRLDSRTGRRTVRGACRRVLRVTALGSCYETVHGFVVLREDGCYHLQDAAGRIHCVKLEDLAMMDDGKPSTSYENGPTNARKGSDDKPLRKASKAPQNANMEAQ
ncbi:MAG: hypothetical protein ACI4SY_02115 [Sutterella sp.]